MPPETMPPETHPAPRKATDMYRSSFQFEVAGGHDVISPHEHRYRIRIDCSGPLGESGPTEGMVVDFRRLRSVAKCVVEREIGGVLLVQRGTARPSRSNLPVREVDFRPTVERLASYIFELVRAELDEHERAAIHRVVVWENESCMASYERVDS